MAVEQKIDSALVVTLSMHCVGTSNLHKGISLPYDRHFIVDNSPAATGELSFIYAF